MKKSYWKRVSSPAVSNQNCTCWKATSKVNRPVTPSTCAFSLLVVVVFFFFYYRGLWTHYISDNNRLSRGLHFRSRTPESQTYRNMPTRSPLQQLDVNTTPLSSISRRQRFQASDQKESTDFMTPLLSRQASPSCSHTNTTNASEYSSPAEFKQWISSVFPSPSGEQGCSFLEF